MDYTICKIYSSEEMSNLKIKYVFLMNCNQYKIEEGTTELMADLRRFGKKGRKLSRKELIRRQLKLIRMLNEAS
jgi:hypothetical protein